MPPELELIRLAEVECFIDSSGTRLAFLIIIDTRGGRLLCTTAHGPIKTSGLRIKLNGGI